MVDTMVAGGTPDLYYEYYQYPPDMQHLCPMRHDYGPVTVPMVSTNSSPPIAMPVQVPPGHVVQQIVDESGTLRHVILSPNHHPLVPIPQHFGAGNPSGSNQPQGYYPGAMPHGYGIFSPLQPGVLGHGPPQGHSPPPLNYHKPERTQRQYNKLKRKLEQKQLQQSQTTPPLSPRKELNGNSKKGVGSVGTSEDGEESSSLQDEEEEISLLVDVLGTIKPPQVSEVTSRSALVQWVPPQIENPQDLSYEVLLSDKGTEGKYKSLYSGEALSCRIEDLTPGTEYCVCVSARLDNVVGCASEPTPLVTPPCRPDPPSQVKLSSRSRNALTIKWQSALDNGARIDYYIVEWDVNGVWTELIRHKNKQAHIPKLQPATPYTFRVAAVNKCGKSDYTAPFVFQTCDSPPPQPAPPSLSHATPNSLALHWMARPQDDDYMLQMEDPDSGHGFLSVYNGKETSYICTALRSFTTYKFRLKSQNEEGSSRWSEEARFRTLASRPAPPSPPQVVKVRPYMCKVSWDTPSDKGGASIICYVVQLAQYASKSDFQSIYTGDNTCCNVEKLLPGTSYLVRVCCEGPGGRSDFSEPTLFTTGALCPGQCPAPRLLGKPRPYSVTLKCGYPDSDGGASLTKMVVAVVKDDGAKEIVATIDSEGEELRGTSKKGDTECIIEDLLPARQYSFSIRASNQLGHGPWSKCLEVQTACARPDCPGPPTLMPGSGVVSCSWTPPSDNGSPITQYTLLMAIPPGENYSPVYTGPATHCDVKPVLPATLLLFKLQATNSLGTSPFSKINTILTSPGVPSAVPNLKCIPAPTSLELVWGEPPANGDPITHYIVEAGEISTNVTETACVIENLLPSTSYRVKVRGVNGVGTGAVSTIKVTTLPPPPSPPVLICNLAGHNYLKLRWGGPNTNHDNINFTVYMYAPNTSRKTVVYEGTSTSYKVNRLQEQTEYGFVIVASNSSGKGPESEVFKFSTVIAPPPPVKGLKVSDVQSRSCQVEWSPLRPQTNDPLEYVVQCARLREQTYRQVYQGSATKYQITDLEPSADYLVKVCAVRQSTAGPIDGPFSSPVNLTTPNLQVDSNPVQSVRQQSVQSGGQRPLTDQQWAGIILCGFSVLAVFISLIIAQIKY